MRVVLILISFLAWSWTVCQAQIVVPEETYDLRAGFQTIHVPQLNVQEASGSNLRAYGARLTFSEYDQFPFEIGLHAFSGYGDISRVMSGISLAYSLTRSNQLDVKIGLGLSRIDLEDVDAQQGVLGPQAGDVEFIGWGTEFKPYIEWEWAFTRVSSIFLQAGYHIINGEKSVVTAVEPTEDRIIPTRISERDRSFFYSASGFSAGIGLSIIF